MHSDFEALKSDSAWAAWLGAFGEDFILNKGGLNVAVDEDQYGKAIDILQRASNLSIDQLNEAIRRAPTLDEWDDHQVH